MFSGRKEERKEDVYIFRNSIISIFIHWQGHKEKFDLCLTWLALANIALLSQTYLSGF